MFSLASGLPIRRSSFNKLTAWRKSTAKIGIPGLHFHDLRHTGNMLAAASKVTTKDLMARMGHDSMEAALSYQHASRKADQSIAAHLNTQLEGLTSGGKKKAKKKGAKATKLKGVQAIGGRSTADGQTVVGQERTQDSAVSPEDREGHDSAAGVLAGVG